MTDLDLEVKDIPDEPFRYILVGNIIGAHYWGENKEIKYGTKQFRAGAKVYLLPEYGGNGHEEMPVYGLPRKRWKKIKIVIRTSRIKNIRVRKTFDPKMIKMVSENYYYRYFHDNADELQQFASYLNKQNDEIKP